MGKNYKDILHKKYEAFSVEENPIKRKLLRMEIHSILRNVDTLDSEDFYIWGLTFYMSSEDKLYDTNLALENFIKSYELDSDNFLACLYVAHCFHDTKDWFNALSFYEKVNQQKLKEFQVWRYVKLIEHIGYCHYKLGNKEIGRQKFEKVLAWYKKSELGELAVPTEIIECLEESDSIVKEIKKIEDYLK
ncbi:MAG: tol-pal system YbgF family protein [Saprospiraceae bacterium]